MAKLVEGKTVEKMANELNSSPHTVRARLKSIYKVLGVHSKEKASAIVVRELEQFITVGEAEGQNGSVSFDALESKLSLREKDILSLVMQGKPNNIIADEAHISEYTVKTHLTSIMKKFNANRVEIVTGMDVLQQRENEPLNIQTYNRETES